jgi:hypothetical protein
VLLVLAVIMAIVSSWLESGLYLEGRSEFGSTLAASQSVGRPPNEQSLRPANCHMDLWRK